MSNNLYEINQVQIGLYFVQTIIATTPEGKLLHIPIDSGNTDYQEYLQDIKNGMSIVTCNDCGDGAPNDSMWQYLDNAEQLLTDKYGSDPSLHDKMTALREDRYVRAMKAEFPYENMKDAEPIINATSQEIKDKYRHLPMRR
tara:strand:+ start:603 stop:1028 length:426 start_codon:yes stop_codon:yes gene_type:complete